jgi:hypothetical protein
MEQTHGNCRLTSSCQSAGNRSVHRDDAVGVDAAVIDIWPPVRRKLPDGVMRFEYPFGEEAGRASQGASPI